MHLGGRDYEAFGLIHLRYETIAHIGRGSLSRNARPRFGLPSREVVKSVLARNSAVVVLYQQSRERPVLTVGRR